MLASQISKFANSSFGDSIGCASPSPFILLEFEYARSGLRNGLKLEKDAGAFGARLVPADAYRFAKGDEIMASSGQPVKLRAVSPRSSATSGPRTTAATTCTAACRARIHQQPARRPRALAEVGLPQRAIPVALLTFNVGVELGQLLFVAAALAVVALCARFLTRAPRWGAWVPPYAIGAIAVFWVVERVASF